MVEIGVTHLVFLCFFYYVWSLQGYFHQLRIEILHDLAVLARADLNSEACFSFKPCQTDFRQLCWIHGIRPVLGPGLVQTGLAVKWAWPGLGEVWPGSVYSGSNKKFKLVM